MSLLDDIAGIVGPALISAGMAQDLTLSRITVGARGSVVTAPPSTTRTDYAVSGIEVSIAQFQIRGTLIRDANRVIKIYGSTLPAGVVPQPGDLIVDSFGVESTIVNDDAGLRAVVSDAARAAYTCQCR